MRVDDGLSSAELGALDRLELELRKLPDVLAVGFEGPSEGTLISPDAVITVHVFVTDAAVRATVEQQALDLGRLHVDRPLRIAIAPEAGQGAATGAAPATTAVSHRVQLLEVGLTDDGAAVEVVLSFDDARATGVGPAAALSGSVEATLAGLRELGWLLPFSVASCVRVTLGASGAVLVHLSGSGGDRFGVAAGIPPQRAAAKATLHALNRWLDDPARRPVALRQRTPPR